MKMLSTTNATAQNRSSTNSIQTVTEMKTCQGCELTLCDGSGRSGGRALRGTNSMSHASEYNPRRSITVLPDVSLGATCHNMSTSVSSW